MNDGELRDLAVALEALLRPHLERSEPARKAVGLLGRWLLELSSQTGATARGTSEPSPTPEPRGSLDELVVEPPPAPRVVEVPAASQAIVTRAVVPLKLGDGMVHIAAEGTTEEIGRARQSAQQAEELEEAPGRAEPAEIELALIEKRSRMKARSCRLAIEQREAEGDDDGEHEVRWRINQLIGEARALPTCFLWVHMPGEPVPEDEKLDTIADCYEAHAEAVALVRTIDAMPTGAQGEGPTRAFSLMAEANSALREALKWTWLTTDDQDQLDGHIWLRRETKARRIFIPRHMTTRDPADPVNAANLRARIQSLSESMAQVTRRDKDARELINRIRYHAGQAVRDGLAEADPHWAKIAGCHKQLMDLGLLPSDARIAAAVGPEAGMLIPDSVAESHGLLETMRRARAITPNAEDAEPISIEPRTWSAAVRILRERLCGRRLVILGGEPDRDAIARMEEAFEGATVDWVELVEHGPGEPMIAPIQRADTALVAIIIKWCGHLHVNEARAYAGAAGKPFVNLKSGCNPEQIANAAMQQASVQLGIGPAAPSDMPV